MGHQISKVWFGVFRDKSHFLVHCLRFSTSERGFWTKNSEFQTKRQPAHSLPKRKPPSSLFSPQMNQIKEIHCFLQHVVDICRKYRWEKSRTLRNLPKRVFWTVFGLVGVMFGWGTFYNWKVKLQNLVYPISRIIPGFQLHKYGLNWPETQQNFPIP